MIEKNVNLIHSETDMLIYNDWCSDLWFANEPKDFFNFVLFLNSRGISNSLIEIQLSKFKNKIIVLQITPCHVKDDDKCYKNSTLWIYTTREKLIHKNLKKNTLWIKKPRQSRKVPLHKYPSLIRYKNCLHELTIS